MYLISVYFDTTSQKRLKHLIDKVAEQTGNHFMLEHQVPPHLTISAFETREPGNLVADFTNWGKSLSGGSIRFISPGALLPYVMYVTPVLNQYLMDLQYSSYDFMKKHPDVKVNRFYQPLQWLPHVTIGKTLEAEQMREAFAVMQKHFVPFEAKVVRIGLAQTNPHKDMAEVILEEASACT